MVTHVEISRDYSFEAAHFLPRVGPNHKCSRLHGHSYAIRIGIAGEMTEEGWLMDFGVVDQILCPIIQSLDHQLLNEVEGLANPTSEVLAVWLLDRIRPNCPGISYVSVSETSRSRAIANAQ